MYIYFLEDAGTDRFKPFVTHLDRFTVALEYCSKYSVILGLFLLLSAKALRTESNLCPLKENPHWQILCKPPVLCTHGRILSAALLPQSMFTFTRDKTRLWHGKLPNATQ